MSGAIQTLSLRIFSTFVDLGFTRFAWPGARKGENPNSIIDFIIGTPSLKGTVQIATAFPAYVSSDHKPLHFRTLAPKRDKRHRKRMMEKYLRMNSQYPRLPANWTPQNLTHFRQEFRQIQATNLHEFSQQAQRVARNHTSHTQFENPERTKLLKGLRTAKDPVVRRAYQICLRQLTRTQRAQKEEEQLRKWASGHNWAFSKPHRLPGAIRVPSSLNGINDRGLWGQLIQEHFQKLYSAPEFEREEVWRMINQIHIRASRHREALICYSEDVRDLIRDLTPGKAAGPDGLPSQVIKSCSNEQISFIAHHFQTIANDLAYQPHTRPDSWKNAIVSLLAKKPRAQHLNDFRPISLIPQLQKLYSKWLFLFHLLPNSENLIPPTQHGFRRKRQCAEMHHIMARLREEHQEWGARFVVIKLDIQKAFDSLYRSAILRAIAKTGTHPVATWALARELINTRLHPQMGGISTAAPVTTTKGVKQGSPDSGYLYILAVANALSPLMDSWEERGFGLRVGRNGEKTNNLAFADDTLLVARTPQQALIMFRELTEALEGIGLLTNEEKTQYVSTFSPEATQAIPGKNMTREGMIVLGRAFALHDTTEKDLARKENAAWHKYRRILPILRQHKPLRHRLRILQAC